MSAYDNHPDVIDIKRTKLTTFATAHATYDRVIVCDIDGDQLFKVVPMNFVDAKKKTLRQIFKFNPEYELDINHRLAFRKLDLPDKEEQTRWAIFARVEQGTDNFFVKSVVKDLIADLKAQKAAHRQSYYVKTMVLDYLEKVAKDYNYPKRDRKTNLFSIARFGARTTRGMQIPFPRTSDEQDEESQESPVKAATPAKKKPGAKTPAAKTPKSAAVKKPVKRLSPKAGPSGVYKPVVSTISKTPGGSKKGTAKSPVVPQPGTSQSTLSKTSSGLQITRTTKPSPTVTVTRKSIATPKGKAGKSPAKGKSSPSVAMPGSIASAFVDADDDFQIMPPPIRAAQSQPSTPAVGERAVVAMTRALSQRSTASVHEPAIKRVGDPKVSPRKNVNVPPREALMGENLLTSTLERNIEQAHISPSVSPVTPVEMHAFDVSSCMRNMKNELVERMDAQGQQIAIDFGSALKSFIKNDLPKALRDAVTFERANNPGRSNNREEMTNAVFKKTLSKLDNKLDNIISKIEDMSKAQKKTDEKVQLLGETAAERRATAVGMIAQILPFKKVGKQLDIFFASSLCRKYLLYYLQPLLECLEEGNLMFAIAHTIVKALFAPIASAHCAIGDTPNGIRKMLYYKRKMPSQFGAWVLGSVIQYTRKTYNLQGTTVKENYLTCRGGIQNKFSNDRQKVLRAALENTPTVAACRDALYRLDMEYREDMLHAIPAELKVMTREEYDSHINGLKPVERCLLIEERGARPPNREFSDDLNVIFKDTLVDAKDTMNDMEMFKLIRVLEVVTKERNKFTESDMCRGINDEYNELLESGHLDLREAMTRFNINAEEMILDDDGLAQLPADITEDDLENLEDPGTAFDDDEAAPTTSRKSSRKRAADDEEEQSPKKKTRRNRICTSARSQRKAELKRRVIQPVNKSSSVDESKDQREFTSQMKQLANEKRFKQLQKARRADDSEEESTAVTNESDEDYEEEQSLEEIETEEEASEQEEENEEEAARSSDNEQQQLEQAEGEAAAEEQAAEEVADDAAAEAPQEEDDNQPPKPASYSLD